MSTELNDHLSDRVTVTPEREVHIAPTQIEPDAAPRQAFSGHGNSSGDAKRKLGRRGVIIASVLAVGAIACAYYAWRILPYGTVAQGADGQRRRAFQPDAQPGCQRWDFACHNDRSPRRASTSVVP